MKLILESKDYELIEDRSSYNHNYYRFTGRLHLFPTVILEICHEDEGYYEFHLIHEGERVFLGCSEHGFGDYDQLSIEFRIYHG